jgi:hypothetical protein
VGTDGPKSVVREGELEIWQTEQGDLEQARPQQKQALVDTRHEVQQRA